MNSALTGANGGFVVCSADDPSMHSSQNEQDSRFYAQFAQIPCFEPADHQEAYDMTREAFDLSERFGLPVMIRHDDAPVAQPGRRSRPAPPRPQNELRTRRPAVLDPPARQRPRRSSSGSSTSSPSWSGIADGSPFNRLDAQRRRPLGSASSPPASATTTSGEPGRRRPARPSDPQDLDLSAPRRPHPPRWSTTSTRSWWSRRAIPLIERQIRGLFGIPGKTVIGKLERRTCRSRAS